MKQFSVYVQMANKRYCHDIVTAEDETEEAAKAAEKKAIAIANEILERYQAMKLSFRIVENSIYGTYSPYQNFFDNPQTK